MEFLNVKKLKYLLSPYLTPCGVGVCWLQVVLFQMPPLLPPCLSLSSIQIACLRKENYWSCLTYREHIVRNTLGLVLASSLRVLLGPCGVKQTLTKSLTLHCCAPSIITLSKQSQSTPAAESSWRRGGRKMYISFSFPLNIQDEQKLYVWGR